MASEEHQHLLVHLKNTVEGLLLSQVPNVWNICGGLNRLHSAIEHIFGHGFKTVNSQDDVDLWIFIYAISWLQPTSAASPSNLIEPKPDSSHVPNRISSDKALMWIYRSLESHTLSQQLSWLLSDREHLLSCFHRTAFLCQEKYGEATLICLRAVEQNQSSLLTEIDPSLYLTKWSVKEQKCHRRCSSFPEMLNRRNAVLSKQASSHVADATLELAEIAETTQQSAPVEREAATDKSKVVLKEINVSITVTQELSTDTSSQPRRAFVMRSSAAVTHRPTDKRETSGSLIGRLKAWNSLPNLLKGDGTHGNRSSKTVPTTPVHSFHTDFPYRSSSTLKLSPSVLQVDYSSVERSDWNASNRKGKQGRSASFSSKSTKSFNSETAKPVALVEISCAPHRPVERRRKSGEKSLVVPDGTGQLSTGPSQLTLLDNSWERTQENENDLSPPPTVSDCVISRSRRESQERANRASKVQSAVVVPRKRKSFIEDGGHSVQPMATGFFPRPFQGQSLTAFLSSGQFSRSNAELDRENAHFNISEAIIQAIEQLKCNRAQKLREEQADESDEEINHLKQRLRLRRSQCQKEKRKLLWGVPLLSDGKTDTTTTTTDQSVSPLSSSPRTPTESVCLSSDEVEDVDLDEAQSLNLLKDSGLSMSMASLYSEADLSKKSTTTATTTTPTTSSCSNNNLQSTVTESLSAEGVALSLIRQFSDKQLPRASDLEWLVSEQDAPQELLPLPGSWPVNPDDAEVALRQTSELRGNSEWAPPRAQIIFTPHLPPVRRILMAKQKYRCAGCGMKVAPEYAHRFRYCEYLGRYFCTGCHSNQLALIPGRIINKWDFTRIQDLLKARVPQYMLLDVEMYSLLDFEHVKSGALQANLRPLIEVASAHVTQCQFCQARGFICELCRSDKVIFPWQLETVTRCCECGSCYHIRCNPPVPCPHCRRISKRRSSSEPVPFAEVATEVATS